MHVLVWVKQLDGFYRDTLREYFFLAPHTRSYSPDLGPVLNSTPKLGMRKGKVKEPEYFAEIKCQHNCIRKKKTPSVKGTILDNWSHTCTADRWSKGKRLSFSSSLVGPEGSIKHLPIKIVLIGFTINYLQGVHVFHRNVSQRFLKTFNIFLLSIMKCLLPFFEEKQMICSCR